MLYDLIIKKKMSIHQCAQLAGIPYTTLRELAHAQTSMLKCRADTLYHLSRALGVSMDELLMPYIRWEIGEASWENYKSTLQHRLKSEGDKAFVQDVVKNMVPFYYYMKKQFAACLYLVALTDYICREHGIKPFAGFEMFRSMKLKNPILPSDAIMAQLLGMKQDQNLIKNAIPEFSRHNIIEGDVRNVC